MGQDVRSPRGPRCIALVGPFQSGKTTLLEAILARTGAIPRAGSVDAGTSVGDASPEARHHKMTVGLTAATTSFMGDSYTFLDCPGSVEFAHDMRAALPAVDAAIVVCEADEKKLDRKSTRLNSSHSQISYAVFCLKKKKKKIITVRLTDLSLVRASALTLATTSMCLLLVLFV